MIFLSFLRLIPAGMHNGFLLTIRPALSSGNCNLDSINWRVLESIEDNNDRR